MDLSKIVSDPNNIPLPEAAPETPESTQERKDAYADIFAAARNINGKDIQPSAYGQQKLRTMAEEAAKVEKAKRLEDARSTIAGISSNENIPPKVRGDVIKSLETEIALGSTVEQLAVDEMISAEVAGHESELQAARELNIGMKMKGQFDIRDAINEAAIAIQQGSHAGSYGEFFGETLAGGALAYLSDNVNINKMISHALGVTDDVWMSLHSGDNVKSAREYMKLYSPEEKVQFIKKAKDYALNNKGIVFDNQYQAEAYVNAIEVILGTDMEAVAYHDDAAFNAYLGVVLTAVPLGASAAKVGSRAVKGQKARKAAQNKPLPDFDDPEPIINPTNTPKRGTPVEKMAAVAPNTSKPMIKAGTENPQVAKQLGSSPEELKDLYMAPRAKGEPIRRGPSLVTPEASVAMKGWDNGVSHQIDELMNSDHLFQQSDVAKQYEYKRDLDNTFADLVENKSVRIHQSVLHEGSDLSAINISYAIGRHDGTAFSSAEEARLFGKTELPKEDINTFRVLGLDTKTNTYREGVEGAEEFLLQADYRALKADKISDETVFSQEVWSVKAATNLATSTFFKKHLAESVADADNIIGLMDEAIAGQMDTAWKAIGGVDKDLVHRILKNEESAERLYSRDKLNDFFDYDLKRLEAYDTMRGFYDNVHNVRNLEFRTALQKEGYQSLTLADQSVNFVKPYNGLMPKTVWYEKEGRVVPREYLDEKGIEVDVVRSHYKKEGESPDGSEQLTDFIAVDKGTYGSRWEPLPGQVLRKVDGYLGRGLNADYVVYKPKSAYVNGELTDDLGDALFFSNNAVDAARRAKAVGGKVRATTSTTTLDAFDSMAEIGLAVHTRKRANMADMDASYKKSLQSPEESVTSARRQSSQSAGMGQLYDYGVNKWMETYGKALGFKSFPLHGPLDPLIKGKTTLSDNIKINEATALRDKIKLYSNQTDETVSQHVKARSAKLAETMAVAAVNLEKRSAVDTMKSQGLKTASALVKTFGRDYANDTKFMAHKVQIAWNTSRQMLIQSGNAPLYGSVKHNAKYFGSGKATADMAALIFMDNMKPGSKMFKLTAGAISKLTGRSLDDIKLLHKQWEQSGLRGSVRSHQHMGHRDNVDLVNHAGTYSDVGAKGIGAWKAAKGLGRTADRTLSKGFETGELLNRRAAWLAARQKNLTEGIDDVRVWTRESNILTGEMNQASKAAFQAKDISVILQYQNFGIRMAQQLIPSKRLGFGEDLFSGGSKAAQKKSAKIAAWSTLVYGAQGMAVGIPVVNWWLGEARKDAAEKGIDVETDTFRAAEKFAEGGLSNLALGSMIEVIIGDEFNSNIAPAMNPYSTVFADFKENERPSNPASLLAHGLYDITVNGVVEADTFGPGMGVVGSMFKSVGNVSDIFHAPGFSQMEKIQVGSQELARVLPLFNNATLGRIAATSGNYVTRYGDPTVKVTMADAMGKALFGITPDAVSKYYELQAKYFKGKGRREAITGLTLKADGKDLARGIVLMNRQLNSGEINQQALLDQSKLAVSLLRDSYENPAQFAVMLNAMHKELENRKAADGTTAVDEFIKAVMSSDDIQIEHGLDEKIKILRELGTEEGNYFADHLQDIKVN